MKIFIITLLATLLFSQNESFSKSKRELLKIHADNQTTFYCGCKYDPLKKDNMIERSSCGYTPRNKYTKKGNLNARANRIEWEHVIPAENFGRQFSCWRDGAPECVTSKGKSYKGRKCCEKSNKEFRIMQADMHNLQPAIGELNADRSNYRFDFELPTPGMYGKCNFEVVFKERRAKIKEELRGVVARTYLYFNKHYNMKLSKQEQQKYEAWNKIYPPTQWEIKRNARIEKVQGNRNGFIKNLSSQPHQ